MILFYCAKIQQGIFLAVSGPGRACLSSTQSSAHFLWITLCVSEGRMTDVLDPKGFFLAARKSGNNEFIIKSIT